MCFPDARFAGRDGSTEMGRYPAHTLEERIATVYSRVGGRTVRRGSASFCGG